jgi:hypothetical protein
MHPAPPATRRRGLAQLALFLALALGLPALIPHHENRRGDGSRDDISRADEIARLESEGPQIIIIGDSMVPCRIDPAQLGRELGRPASLLTFDGSASASWFLLAKNVAARVDPRPAWLVVFFRDNHFHFPLYRTGGQRQAFIDSLRAGAEPEFDFVLSAGRHRGNPVIDRTADLMDALWRLDGYQEEAAGSLRNLAFDATSLGSPRRAREMAIEHIFALANLRGDLAAGEEGPEATERVGGDQPAFTDDPADSFLPHLLHATREAGMRLCLYRVKRRRHASGAPDPAHLTAYLAGLQAWAAANGVAYADETGDPALAITLFADGDHTQFSARPLWTNRAASHLQPVLQP